MTVRIGNARHGTKGEYIGRPARGFKGSPLANPYKVEREAERDVMVEHYREWLFHRVAENDHKVMPELQRLRELARRPEGLTLLCWCAPKTCHASIIRQVLLGLG